MFHLYPLDRFDKKMNIRQNILLYLIVVCGNQPGADDNASAVAGLLEIARFAKKNETDLPYRIDFVTYSLEEPPYFKTENMGSYIHAKSLQDKNIKVKGMICLEMIGLFSDEKDSQSYPLSLLKLFYPTEGNYSGYQQFRELFLCFANSKTHESRFNRGKETGSSIIHRRHRFFRSPELLELWIWRRHDHRYGLLQESQLS